MDPEKRNALIVIGLPVIVAYAALVTGHLTPLSGAVLISLVALPFLVDSLRHARHFTSRVSPSVEPLALSFQVLILYIVVYTAGRSLLEVFAPVEVGGLYALFLGLNVGFLALFFYWLSRTIRIMENTVGRFEDVVFSMELRRQPLLPVIAIAATALGGLVYAASVLSAANPVFIIGLGIVTGFVLTAVFWIIKKDLERSKGSLKEQDKVVLTRLYFTASILLDLVLLTILMEIMFPRSNGAVEAALLGGVQIAAPILAFFQASYMLRAYRQSVE